MSLFSSIGGGNLLSSLVNTVAQGALAVATGGTSLIIATAFQGLLSQIGNQIIQQIGQQLGLPQPMIDVAQAAFDGATGNAAGFASNISEASQGLASALGGGAFEAGQIERQANDATQDVAKAVLKGLREGGADLEEGGLQGKQSFLVKLALAMGKLIDSKMERAVELGEKMDAEQKKDKPVTGSISAEMQAVSQEINMITQALNTVVKSIGEAGANLARKQG